MQPRPERTREYHGAIFDSRYWDRYTPRSDDIVISTSMKAGTTWMQRICAALVFQKPELELPMDALSPWIDMRLAPPGFVFPMIEAQTHRRFLKSHLPLDAIPFYDEVKYVVVCRDARDVFMSTVNHLQNMTPRIYDEINTHDGAELLAYRERIGVEIAPPEREAIAELRHWEGEAFPLIDANADIHECWRNWITRSAYPWESDGYPTWSHLYHLASWWPYRKLPNIIFMHYSDLLADLDGQMRMLSAWLDIPVDEAVWPSLVAAATFETMKGDYQKTTPVITQSIWRDPQNFFHKGSTGQWQDVLSDEEIGLYEDAAGRALEPDAKRWMEDGSLAFAYPKDI